MHRVPSYLCLWYFSNWLVKCVQDVQNERQCVTSMSMNNMMWMFCRHASCFHLKMITLQHINWLWTCWRYYCSNTVTFPILILSKIHTCSIIKKSNKQNLCCIPVYTHEVIILILQASASIPLNNKNYYYNHNYNKILKSDWLSTVLISTTIGQCNGTTRLALDSMRYCTYALK